MSSSRSLRPWPRRCTTPHEDGGRPGLGRRSELNYTDKDRKTPPLQPVLFSLYEEEPGGRRPASLAEPPGPQERVQRHTMEQLADVAPMVPSLAVPEPQMVDQLVAMIKHVDSVVPEQIIAVPKISGHPAFLVRFSVSRRRRNSWWKCLSLPPPSVTGSAGTRPTGSRVIRGLVASNGASPPAQGGI